MKNVYKWRIVTNKYLYITDEENSGPFIFNKVTKERTYSDGTPQVDDYGVDEGKISQIVSQIRDASTYESMFNDMVDLAMTDEDTSKLNFLDYTKYFNLDSEECVQEAVTPKCEGYEPVFNISAHTIDDTEVSYTFFPERNEQDKTLRYNLDLGIPRGLQGEPGEDATGCKGDKGDDGKPAVITSADATAYALPSSVTIPTAEVVVVPESGGTETENDYAFHFTFGLPQGPKGDKGDNGPAGYDGKDAIITNVTADVDPLDYGQQPQVSVTTNTTSTSSENQTEMYFHFDLPSGPQGEEGPQGEPATIRNAYVDSVVTIDYGAQASATCESIFISGNTYDLKFNFWIPQGQDGSSGGGGGDILYRFHDITNASGVSIGYFTDLPNVDGSHDIYATIINGGGGGGPTDIRHRYNQEVDSLSEGVQPIEVDNEVLPYAVASGVRSHSEGIGCKDTSIIYGNVVVGDSGTHVRIWFRDMPEDFTLPFSEFINKIITVNGETYTLVPSGQTWGNNDNTWEEDGGDVDYEATFREFSILNSTGGTVTNLEIFDGIEIPFSLGGNFNNAIGIATHTEGNSCQAIGDYSHAEGLDTKTDERGVAAHAEGIGFPIVSSDVTCTLDSYCFKDLEGDSGSTTNIIVDEPGVINIIGCTFEYDGTTYTVTAATYYHIAENSHTLFTYVTVTDGSSDYTIEELLGSDYEQESGITLNGVTVESRKNAVGAASHTEGNQTIADGDYSHAEGSDSVALGVASHAEGINTRAFGDASHASGSGTIAYNDNMTVVGQFNDTDYDNDSLFVVGNGNSINSRSNALVVQKNNKIILGSYRSGIRQGRWGGVETTFWNTLGETSRLSGGTGIQITTAKTDELTTITITNSSSGSGTVTSITAGTGLSGGTITSSGTISHADTSTATTTTNSGRTYIQNVGLDSMGHVTGLTGATETVVNTDYQVQQSASTTNSEYCLLAKALSGTSNATVTSTTIYNPSIKINPSTGNLYTGGAFYAASDERKKDVVGEISLDKAYELIEKCQTIYYTWKNDEEKAKQIGLLAQEVQAYFPELVSETSDGYLSLDYSKLTVILMAVIKDLTSRVKKLESLEERIKQLEEKNK